MTNDQRQWAHGCLIEHANDMIHNRVDFFPSRVDLKSINGELWSVTGTENGQSSEARQLSTLQLFQEAYKLSTRPNFECVLSCEDVPRKFLNKPAFMYCTHWDKTISNSDTLFPDYCYDSPTLKGRYGFTGEGDDSYEAIVESIKQAGQSQPLTNKVGWAGFIEHNWRRIEALNLYNSHPDVDIIDVSWYKNAYTGATWPPNYISYVDQVKKWRYLLDIQGNTWSDRIKFFYFSNRLIFRINRHHDEFYDKFLTPWEHYVPVDNNQDLASKIELIKNDPKLEERIKANAYAFANNRLTKQSVVDHIKSMIDDTDWEAKLKGCLQEKFDNTNIWEQTKLYSFDLQTKLYSFDVSSCSMPINSKFAVFK
jgi:hypothetical protein